MQFALTLVGVLPTLIAASSVRRQSNATVDLFDVLAQTGVAAGFNLNPFGAADQRFWLPDRPASGTFCPPDIQNCPDVNLTIIASPSTLDSTIGTQEIYVQPGGVLRFLPAGATRDDAPPGSLFETFIYEKNPNSPLLGTWFFQDTNGNFRPFFACQNTTENAFTEWQVYVSIDSFAPTVEQDCIEFNTFAQVYTGESPTAFEYV
ncbi:hypothetical protein F5884DRAFT_249469 [Xylogone sp. PMI_703]|nr:hypothetical protein F5884DRAFT_249469 [Xylogone sp. PMI_703]